MVELSGPGSAVCVGVVARGGEADSSLTTPNLPPETFGGPFTQNDSAFLLNSRDGQFFGSAN